MKTTILILATALLLTSCSTPDLTNLTPEERQLVLAQNEARKTQWSNAGLNTLQTGTAIATQRLSRSEGLKK